MTNEVMASDLGVPTFEPTVACAGYCYGGVVRMHPTEYPQFTSVADVWVKGDAVAALRDKNDVLRAENTRLRDEVSDLDALRVRVAELEADAARYRWLRDHANEAWVQWADEREDSTSADIDAAIDRARDVPSAGDVHTPAAQCKQCGLFLDARGKCRYPEHNE